MKTTASFDLALPTPATAAPTQATLKKRAQGLARTLQAGEEIEQSIAAFARYAFSLLQYANGLELLADLYYETDVALFNSIGRKIDNPASHKWWKTFTNQVRILATKKADRTTDNGKVFRVTCPGGEYRIVYRNKTAEEKRKSAEKLQSNADDSRGGGQTAGDDQFTPERIAAYLERVLQADSGRMTPDDLVAIAVGVAFKTKRARKAALKRMVANA